MSNPQSSRSIPEVDGNFEITVVSETPATHNHVLAIRKWSTTEADPACRRAIRVVSKSPNIRDGLAKLRSDRAHTILVVTGRQGNEVYALLEQNERGSSELVILPPTPPAGGILPSSTLLTEDRTFVAGDPKPALRKALLRLMTEQYAIIRRLRTPQDFAKFFALRYKVWTEMGYIPLEKQCDQSQWELDYTDRNAVPIGAFARRGGQMLAAARLVGPLGPERMRYVGVIEELIAAKGDPKLAELFNAPVRLQQQFDLLEAFEGFNSYYRRLKEKRLEPMAEVSRVVVHPDLRNQRLGEVVVDSLVSEAYKLGCKILFLACVPLHERFYARCGFRTIERMTCNAFDDENVAAIAMDRQLGN